MIDPDTIQAFDRNNGGGVIEGRNPARYHLGHAVAPLRVQPGNRQLRTERPLR